MVTMGVQVYEPGSNVKPARIDHIDAARSRNVVSNLGYLVVQYSQIALTPKLRCRIAEFAILDQDVEPARRGLACVLAKSRGCDCRAATEEKTAPVHVSHS